MNGSLFLTTRSCPDLGWILWHILVLKSRGLVVWRHLGTGLGSFSTTLCVNQQELIVQPSFMKFIECCSSRALVLLRRKLRRDNQKSKCWLLMLLVCLLGAKMNKTCCKLVLKMSVLWHVRHGSQPFCCLFECATLSCSCAPVYFLVIWAFVALSSSTLTPDAPWWEESSATRMPHW